LKHILSGCRIKVKIKILLTSLLLFYSCSSDSEVPKEWLYKNGTDNKELSVIQNHIIEGSYWAKGRNSLVVHDRTFNIDCSGTVMAIYYYAGIDLSKDFSKYKGGGVSRIYQYLKAHNLIYFTKTPVPGDIIFWDNTYDSNNDGIRNDNLTHAGIVVNVSEDKTVTYIHAHYKKGIILETMNLMEPDNLEKNSAMRMKGSGMEGGWLSGHLYRESGIGYKLND